jgi:hypothetical protein
MRKFIKSVALFALVLGGIMGCKSNNETPLNSTDPSTGRTTAPGQSANNSAVIYSTWATVPQWSALTNSAGYLYYQYVFSGQNRIDAAALNQGTILAYVRFEGSTEVHQVPFRRAWDRTPGRLYYENWYYRANVGQLLIGIDPELNGYAPPTTAQVRYIIIPGDSPSTGRKAAIDYNNYEEVKKAFNILD